MFTYYSQNYAGIIGTGLTTRMHFLALRGINITAWGTKLPLMAVLSSPVDCIGSCQILKAEVPTGEGQLGQFAQGPQAVGGPKHDKSLL